MISFPWDAIIEGFGEDGFPIYDRTYTARELRRIYKSFFTNGILADLDEELAVTVNGMIVTVGYGGLIIEGTYGGQTQEEGRKTLNLESGSNLPRIDCIVARWNVNIAAREIELYVVKGTPSSNPQPPALTRSSSVYELGLANILVPANATSVTQSNVTDTRLDSSRCGLATPYMEIDTTSFYNQLQAAISEGLAKHQQQADAQMDRLRKQSDAAIDKINNELDRIIFISDRITSGKPEGCGCYEEMQAIKKLLYELLGETEQYYVVGKTLYPPKGSMTIDGKKATISDMKISGKTAHFN